MITTLLLVLLLIVMIVMAIRDGRPFWSDYLRFMAFVIALLLALFTWLPIPAVR